jgi:hypothetical protein
MHCGQCTNNLTSAHKLLSPLPTHGYYGANFSTILTAVYFHDLHAPSRHDVSVQERCGTVHCYIHQSHDLHSLLNINCIWNEIASFNKLPMHLLSLYWKLLHTKVSTSEFFIDFLPCPALPTILKIQLTNVPFHCQCKAQTFYVIFLVFHHIRRCSCVCLQDGGTPLFVASQCGHFDVVTELVARGAKVSSHMKVRV